MLKHYKTDRTTNVAVDRDYRGRGERRKLTYLMLMAKCFIYGLVNIGFVVVPHDNEAEEVRILLMASEKEPLNGVMDTLTAEGYWFCSRPG